MSAFFNIYKTLYFNSNKNSKKTIFSKSTSTNSYNKNFHSLFKNISLIKPKAFFAQKKTNNKNNSKKEKIYEKLKLFYSYQNKNRNNIINYNRKNIIWSPTNKKNNLIRKKLILFNYSNSNSIRLSKASYEQKMYLTNKNEKEILINCKKEKNKLSNLIAKQKYRIDNLKNKNQIYKNKLALLEKENKILNDNIKNYVSNQEQLVLLIKIIQRKGINIQKLIDEYNNNIYKNKGNNINNDINNKINDNINNNNTNNNNINNNNINNSNINNNESISEVNVKIESNSFIPITIAKSHETKISKIKIPKLNFDKIKKKNDNN